MAQSLNAIDDYLSVRVFVANGDNGRLARLEVVGPLDAQRSGHQFMRFSQRLSFLFVDVSGLKCHETIRTPTQAKIREAAITAVIPSGARSHSLPPAHASQKKQVIKSMTSGTSSCNKPMMRKKVASIP